MDGVCEYVHIFHSPVKTLVSNLQLLLNDIQPLEPNLRGLLMTISQCQTPLAKYFTCFASHNKPLTSTTSK